MESWGVAQRPIDYILVTIRITIRNRESVPDHDPDPRRTATLSIVMLAFSGGLCSLSTCSYYRNHKHCLIQLKIPSAAPETSFKIHTLVWRADNYTYAH